MHFIGFVRWGDDVEGYGGAEVEHDAGTAVEGVGTDGVCQAIGTDLLGLGVVDADRKFAKVTELMAGFVAEP